MPGGQDLARPRKTFQTVPRDENSVLQASERIHYQYWLRSDITVIPDIDLSENGWIIVEGHVQPV